MGTIYRRKDSKKLWIKYYKDGRASYESSGSTRRKDAEKLLKLREGDVARGVPVTPQVGRLRFDEAAKDVVNDYRTNGKRSLRDIERRLRLHLLPYFGRQRMTAISTTDTGESSSGEDTTGGIDVVMFAAIGDYGNDSSDEQRVADLVSSWNVEFVITLGDNNYPDGEAATIDETIGQYYSDFIGEYIGAYGPVHN